MNGLRVMAISPMFETGESIPYFHQMMQSYVLRGESFFDHDDQGAATMETTNLALNSFPSYIDRLK
jgi:hypothetical protein